MQTDRADETAASPPTSPAPRRIPPAPRGHWLWGIAPGLVERPLETFAELARLGDVVQLRLGPFTGYLVNHPELIKRVFQDLRIYGKQTTTYFRVRPLLGLGLVTSDGDFWLRQRRIAQPAFHRQRIAGFAETMVRAAEDTAERWRASSTSGEALDVAAEMTRITLQVVCETLLGSDAGDAVEVVGSAFSEVNRLLRPRLAAWVPSPLWVPTRANRRINACIAALDDTVYRIIARRRAQKEETPDLLSLLLRARDPETGEGMSDRQLRDEVMTVLLAGHETTAVALAWSFYLLSQNPEASERLHDELDEVLDGRAPGLADLERLKYTRMVIDESMRLYPPVWAATRSVASDDDLGGYRIPRGRLVFVSSWSVHRSPSLWTEPDAFRPERFAAERAESLPRYAYFPFLGGPRQCIGNQFALMEAQLVLATLFQRYHLSLVPGHPIEPEPLLTLRPKYGVKMTVSERKTPS